MTTIPVAAIAAVGVVALALVAAAMLRWTRSGAERRVSIASWTHNHYCPGCDQEWAHPGRTCVQHWSSPCEDCQAPVKDPRSSSRIA